MELTEPIDSINRQLKELYGVDTLSGHPIWRVVFSEEQFEYRYGTYADFDSNGMFIREVTETRFVPKYRQWIRAKYVLERLTIVPEINEEDLPANKTSYEPMYVYENFKGEPLPPRVDVAKILIDSLYAAMGKQSLAKYKDEMEQYTPEAIDKRINELVEYLWDPSDIAEAVHQKEGIFVPSSDNGIRRKEGQNE